MNYKFLIYISYSYSIPIGIPLEKEILKRGYTVKWFADDLEGKMELKKKSNSICTVQEILDFSPHIILTATDSVPDFFDALKVQIFHGFHAEKRPGSNNSYAHFRLRGFFDLYCTHGPNTTEIFKKLSQQQSYFKVVETGWSKVDPLFPLQKKKVTGIPTVMIASTFTKRLSLAYDDDVYNKIKQLIQSQAYKFNMVLHPKLPESVKAKWKGLNSDNFTFYDTTDLIPLFKKSDIMFADTTSAIQEFILQKKPVVTLRHTMDRDYLIDIKNANDIEQAFLRALSNEEEILNNIKKYIQKLHPYTDGTSSQRILDAAIDFLHEDKTHLKSKPLNLVRKYKIRRKLNYFSFKSFNKPFTITKN